MPPPVNMAVLSLTVTLSSVTSESLPMPPAAPDMFPLTVTLVRLAPSALPSRVAALLPITTQSIGVISPSLSIPPPLTAARRPPRFTEPHGEGRRPAMLVWRRARTDKVGGSACSLPPCRRPEPSGESGASSTPTSRAGLVQGRVNLLVAADEVATVVDVRRRYARTRHRRQLLGGRIGAGHLLAEGQAAARIGVHEPDPNTIPVGRRWSVCPPWLTAIFDIDPEDHAPALAPPVGEGVVPRAREADLVGRRPPRFGPANAVVGIAQRTHHPLHIGILR